MRRVIAAVSAAVLVLGSVAAADPPEPVALKGHKGPVVAVAWGVDGKSLASAGDDRTIRVWDPATGRETKSLTDVAKKGYGSPVVAFTADLKTVAVNYWGEITIRTAADGKELLKIDPLGDDRGKKSTFRPDVYAMAFSPDGKRLATAGSVAAQGLPGGAVTIWDAQTGKVVHRFDKLSTAAGAVAWSPDGKLLAAGTNGVGGELPQPGVVVVWDTQTGKDLHTFKVKASVEQGEWASAADVAFSPDGKRVAVPVTAGGRGAPAGIIIEDTGASVNVWDLGTGKATQPVKGLKSAVSRVVFSPDGKRLATAGADKMVRLWDAESGKEVVALPAGDRVEVVAFSPDGKSLAAGGKDGTVRVWAVPAK